MARVNSLLKVVALTAIITGCSATQNIFNNTTNITIFSGSIRNWKGGENELVYAIYDTKSGKYQEIASAKINSNGSFSIPSVTETQLKPYLVTEQNSYLVSCNGGERLSSNSSTSKSQQGTFFVYEGETRIGTLDLATYDTDGKISPGDLSISPKFSTENSRVTGYQSECYGRNATVQVEWNSSSGWNNSILTALTTVQGKGTSYKLTTGPIPTSAFWQFHPY